MAQSTSTIKEDIASNVFIYPTDTVWGIGASIYFEEGVELVRSVKKSRKNKPLSILFDKINNFKNYFNLPAVLNDDFLSSFFSLETTLLLPVSWLNKDVPKWVICDSQKVGCRCLPDVLEVQKLIRIAKGPVTTSSLNLAGEEPVVNYKAAFLFLKSHISTATLIEISGKQKKLSGKSSTLVEYDGKEFKILRDGRNADEVREIVGL